MDDPVSLAIVANVSAGFRLSSESCCFQITTTEASTITVERSIDGVAYSEVPDYSLAANGTVEDNLVDFKRGQFVRFKSTGAMTSCKILD